MPADREDGVCTLPRRAVWGTIAELHDGKFASNPPDRCTLQLTSAAMTTANPRFPYPVTENWQKTVGGHSLWVSADVEVVLDRAAQVRLLNVKMTYHAEDQNNFDPKKVDIATGIPDSDNGAFELCGLAKEYRQTAEVMRSFTCKVPIFVTCAKTRTPADLDIPRVIDPGLRSSPCETIEDITKRQEGGAAPSP